MKRRKAIKSTAYASVCTLFLSQLLACKTTNNKTATVIREEMKKRQINLPSDALFQMDYLQGNVGYFTEKGGTIGWMVDNGHVVVVDTQFPEQSQHLIDQLSSMQDGHIDLLINTHHHGDHTSGNIVFKNLAGKIVAHENSLINQKKNAKEKANEAAQLFPNETFSDSWNMKVGSEMITMDYFGAGHTNGDAITHFQNANVVHIGDLVFNRRFPYIDTSVGANIESWISVLDKALNKFDNQTKFIFGHSDNGFGIVGGKEDVKAFQNYLTKLLDFGRLCVKQGRTLDEVKQSTFVIPGAPEWKGKGIERSLEAVFLELS